MSATYDVEVRAYDLGGFGDVAGALRVADHLRKSGMNVGIRPITQSVVDKLKILKSDIPITTEDKAKVLVDVAGHYKDNRNINPTAVPHHFSEDMDNPGDRRQIVPIYLKTGLQPFGRQVSDRHNGHSQNPLFYRPLREEELPMPQERDVERDIFRILERKDHWASYFYNQRFNNLKERFSKGALVGFAHTMPYSPIELLRQPYFAAVSQAANFNPSTEYIVGSFVTDPAKSGLVHIAKGFGWNVVLKDGIESEYRCGSNKTLVFLGPQPQMTTTGLFLSATMPNLVTGDLTLSDALYGNLAMQGPGFFYDVPPWKMPTFKEMLSILGRKDPLLGNAFMVGSVLLSDEAYQKQKTEADQAWAVTLGTFINPQTTKNYNAALRDALQAEIVARFGAVDVHQHGDSEWKYVSKGSPFLIQDATEAVVRALLEKPDVYMDAELMRKILSGEAVPSVIVDNVGFGEIKPAQPQIKQQEAQQSTTPNPSYGGSDLESLIKGITHPKIHYINNYKDEDYLADGMLGLLQDNYKTNKYGNTLENTIYNKGKKPIQQIYSAFTIGDDNKYIKKKKPYKKDSYLISEETFYKY